MIIFKRLFLIAVIFPSHFLFSALPVSGNWRGSLCLNDSTFMEVNMQLNFSNPKKPQVTFINGTEKIKVDEVSVKGDSLFIRMPVFDSEFRLKIKKDSLKGKWFNYSRKEKNVLAFWAVPRKKEMPAACKWYQEIDGKYESTFNWDSQETYKGIGIFKGFPDATVHGTFMTESGDHRYLWGKMWKNRAGELRFNLQCFDGAHAFYYDAAITEGGSIFGDFYSGAHSYEKWTAVKNDSFSLHDPTSLTRLKKENEKFDFVFPNTEGKKVSITDEKFKNKVVIVQIMGSWCPNCLDETKYLSEFYKSYKNKGVEIVALAYEKTTDFKKAAENVLRLKKKCNAEYEMLITGVSGKEKATETLPTLNAITSFPTTIYVDKKGKIRKIYTGFNGPATGIEYEKFKKDHETFIQKLLSE